MKLSDPREVASTVVALMEGFGAPWCVAGGWALDLYLGRATRPHSDVELAVFRQDQSRLHAHFAGWTFTEFGVAVLGPEIALLFKAKAPREKDEADFHASRHALSDASGQWLRAALVAHHPDHPWIGALGSGS